MGSSILFVHPYIHFVEPEGISEDDLLKFLEELNFFLTSLVKNSGDILQKTDSKLYEHDKGSCIEFTLCNGVWPIGAARIIADIRNFMISKGWELEDGCFNYTIYGNTNRCGTIYWTTKGIWDRSRARYTPEDEVCNFEEWKTGK